MCDNDLIQDHHMLLNEGLKIRTFNCYDTIFNIYQIFPLHEVCIALKNIINRMKLSVKMIASYQ